MFYIKIVFLQKHVKIIVVLFFTYPNKQLEIKQN